MKRCYDALKSRLKPHRVWKHRKECDSREHGLIITQEKLGIYCWLAVSNLHLPIPEIWTGQAKPDVPEARGYLSIWNAGEMRQNDRMART